jgi:DNA-binding IclR family transcriptional regulator
VLEELVHKVGETAHIAVIRDFEVVHLDGVLADQMVLTAVRVGQRLPVHCTALGKVLVGCGGLAMQESFGRSIASDEGLTPRTESTIVDTQKLFDELRSVSAQGFAVDLEECERGMRCVAAPVHDMAGSVVAAISISGPGFRLSEEALHGDIGRRVVASAEHLSQELGYGL